MTSAQLIEQTRITDVWKWLGGCEIRRGRAQAFWRKDADGWSVSLSDENCTWYDHRDGIGSGILDLIVRVRGGTRGEALRWLADWRCVRLDGDAPLSFTDRHRYAQARRDAPELARKAGLWYAERREDLERLKADAVACGDHAALASAAREHSRLTTLRPDGAAIIREYLRARRADPEGTAALVAEGERWARVSEALVTLLIARWARDPEAA
jgi:hypothetical protein